MVKKIWIGTLMLLVILTASVYLVFDDKFKIVVGNTNTQYFVYEDSWVLAATEYVNLYDGTTKMRASSRNVNYSIEDNITKIVRTSTWKDNITTIQTYSFESNETDIKRVPINNTFECYNCQGKIVHYEIKDILYEGVTKLITSPFSFGHNMAISWQDGAYYSKVFQQSVASDKIIIKYRPTKDYETYEVRLFDPPLHGVSYGLDTPDNATWLNVDSLYIEIGLNCTNFSNVTYNLYGEVF